MKDLKLKLFFCHCHQQVTKYPQGRDKASEFDDLRMRTGMTVATLSPAGC